jgi:hypothetical protein
MTKMMRGLLRGIRTIGLEATVRDIEGLVARVEERAQRNPEQYAYHVGLRWARRMKKKALGRV